MTDLLVSRILPDTSADLRHVLRRLGGQLVPVDGGSDTARGVEDSVVVLDDDIAPIDDVDGAPVSCWVDGTQASAVVAWRDGRPITLTHVAAGAVAGWREPIGLIEELRLIAAAEDVPWVTERAGNIPVNALPDSAPPDVEFGAYENIGGAREELEKLLVSELLNVTGSDDHIVCDGSLLARRRDQRLIGVVKSHQTRYLPDEDVLWTLPVGHRSPTFRIGDPDSGGRYSCYVRLWDATGKRWNFGLVRIEAFDEDLLDPVARTVFDNRQTASANDSRWDRHLFPIAACEHLLKSRQPQVFGYLDQARP